MTTRYDDLKALLLNCSIKYDSSASHTRRLLARSAGIMASQGVDVELLHVLDHEIPFGMVKDATLEDSGARAQDDWPGIQAKIMDADILVIGTPIWLGMKSRVRTSPSATTTPSR